MNKCFREEIAKGELICSSDRLGECVCVRVCVFVAKQSVSKCRRHEADVVQTDGGSPAPERSSCWAVR